MVINNQKRFVIHLLSILCLPHTSMQILLLFFYSSFYCTLNAALFSFKMTCCCSFHSQCKQHIHVYVRWRIRGKKKRWEGSFFFLCLSAFVCALKAACVRAVQWSLCGWLLSPLFPPPLPAFLPFYLLPLKQITQTQKIPCEAEINAAVIYKQSQQMHKGESPIAGEWVFLQRGGYWRACCCGTWFLFAVGLTTLWTMNNGTVARALLISFLYRMKSRVCSSLQKRSLWMKGFYFFHSFVKGLSNIFQVKCTQCDVKVPLRLSRESYCDVPLRLKF